MFGGVLCARPKTWLLSSHLLISHGSAAHHRHASATNLLLSEADSVNPQRFLNDSTTTNNSNLNSNFNLNLSGGYGSASVWHAVLPAAGSDRNGRSPVGEGSWNVAWDVRPARWLHRPHTAWLLFGICACLAAPPLEASGGIGIAEADDKTDGSCTKTVSENYSNFKITGVPADGRCLFRAIAHMVCLRNGEEAPDEDRQKQLADQLRAQVVDELLKRRKETEWFIEGDFDEYVQRIQKPFVWGGEPELLMASHVLKTTISVYMLDRSSQTPLNIATYGKEYEKDGESAIKVLFHGYGHYDILEDIS